MIVASPAMKPPTEAIAFEKVPMMRSTSRSRWKCSAVPRPVQETAACATGPVLADGVEGGLLDSGVVGQSQVVVRAEHDHPAAADHDLRILGRIHDPEKRVDAGLPDAFGVLEPEALVE